VRRRRFLALGASALATLALAVPLAPRPAIPGPTTPSRRIDRDPDPDRLDRWASLYGVAAREPGESEEDLIKRILEKAFENDAIVYGIRGPIK